jgi:hypothetical protein
LYTLVVVYKHGSASRQYKRISISFSNAFVICKHLPDLVTSS